MIEEAATWAAPAARRQNLRFCRRGRLRRLGSPKGFQPLPLKRPLRGLAAPGAGPPPQRSAKGWPNLPAKRGKIEKEALTFRMAEFNRWKFPLILSDRFLPGGAGRGKGLFVLIPDSRHRQFDTPRPSGARPAESLQ